MLEDLEAIPATVSSWLMTSIFNFKLIRILGPVPNSVTMLSGHPVLPRSEAFLLVWRFRSQTLPVLGSSPFYKSMRRTFWVIPSAPYFESFGFPPVAGRLTGCGRISARRLIQKPMRIFHYCHVPMDSLRSMSSSQAAS